jgi:glycosyltransferase involved in cell wall biosynthesis
MVGPDPLRSQGGMATVAATLLRHGRDAVALRCVPTHSDGSVPHRLRVWLSGSLRVLGLVATRRIDVLHVHVSERGSVLRKSILVLAARMTAVPVLLHCHGARFFDWYRILPKPARTAIAAVFRSADQVVVIGERSRANYLDVLGLDPNRVVVAPNAISLPAEVPQRSTEAGIGVLFLGRFGERKGSADVLTAIAALPAGTRERVLLRMAGDGEFAATIAVARRLGVRAEITGWLAPAQRDAALADAHLFVLPSRQEELPMALLEAMGWGLAPIVTPVGSIPDVLADEHNGLLVAPGEISQLTRAIDRLVTDDALRTRLAGQARRTALGFDAVEYTARMAQRWIGLAERKRRPVTAVSASGRRDQPGR